MEFSRVLRRVRAAGFACLVLGCFGSVPVPALAHDAPHVLEMLFLPQGYVLLTNRGLIFGDSARSNWQLMCNEALGITTAERPGLISLRDGRLLAATSRGLVYTSDQGCSWIGLAPFAETSVPALIHQPGEPDQLYLAAYGAEEPERGGLYVSDDSAATWRKLLAVEANDFLHSILVAPSDPQRLYASGQSWDAQGKYTHYVVRSQDGGEHWERTTVELEPDELELRLFAVSPTDSELIAARAGGQEPASIPERLLVSRDGGRTFSSPVRMKLLSALAFGADAAMAWAAGQEGLWESSDQLRSFTRIGAAESLSYVVERDGELFAGGYYAGLGSTENGVGVAASSADGFASFMQLAQVAAPIACDARSATARTCAPWWSDWQREIGAGAADAAVTDAAVGGTGVPPVAGSHGGAASSAGSGGAQPTDPSAGSSGCAALPGTREPAKRCGMIALAGLLIGAWSRRRRHAPSAQ